jgi:hypothetical protein
VVVPEARNRVVREAGSSRPGHTSCRRRASKYGGAWRLRRAGGAPASTLPEARRLTLPEARRLILPEARRLTLPEARRLTLPEARRLILPEARGLTLPEARRLALRRSARRLRRDTAGGWQKVSHPVRSVPGGSPGAATPPPGPGGRRL